jgi:hypothetical protein
MNKENLVEISDYFRELRNNHKIKINICPRQTGVTYDLIDGSKFIVVEKAEIVSIIKNKYPTQFKDTIAVLTTSNIERYDKVREFLSELNNKQKLDLKMDNCMLFFDEDGNRIKPNNIPQKLFHPFNPSILYNNLYVHKNTFEVFKMFNVLEFWYTC